MCYSDVHSVKTLIHIKDKNKNILKFIISSLMASGEGSCLKTVEMHLGDTDIPNHLVLICYLNYCCRCLSEVPYSVSTMQNISYHLQYTVLHKKVLYKYKLQSRLLSPKLVSKYSFIQPICL